MSSTPAPPESTPQLALARRGERLAARHLTSLGMVVLDRNWRCPHGEIDLVLRDGDDLVVCEVKTRSTTAYGDPLEAITWEKARRLRRLAAAYLATTTHHLAGTRLDAVRKQGAQAAEAKKSPEGESLR